MIPAIIGGIFALGSAIVGGITSSYNTGTTNSSNRREAQKNRDFQSEEAQKNRDFESREASIAHQRALELQEQSAYYNSAEYKMQDAQKAGLNPYSVVDQAGNVGVASGAQASAPSTPSGSMPTMQQNQVGSIISQLIPEFAKMDLYTSEADKNRADAKRTNSLLPKELKKLDAEFTKLMNSADLDAAQAYQVRELYDLTKKRLQNEIDYTSILMQGAQIQNQLQSLNLEYAEIEKLQNLAYLASQTDVNIQQIKESRQRVRESQQNVVESQSRTDLNRATEAYVGSQKRSLDIDIDLKNYSEADIIKMRNATVELACANAGITTEEYHFVKNTRWAREKQEFSKIWTSNVGKLANDLTQSIVGAGEDIVYKVNDIDAKINAFFDDYHEKHPHITSEQIINGASQ